MNIKRSATYLLEALDTRTLFSSIGVATDPSIVLANDAPLQININFQPANSVVPSGFYADSGQVYADRGNGYSYGWEADISTWTRDRNSPKSPDQAYDTLIHTQQGGNHTWEIALPNGNYTVRIVGGDASFWGAPIQYAAENQIVANGYSTSTNRFVEGTATITVADGKLTLTNGAGGTNNKIDFIQITAIDTTTTVTGVTIPARIEAEDFTGWKDNTATNDGGAYRNTPVDIQVTSDTGGGYNVGFITAGEWLEYDINVTTAGNYRFDTRWATQTHGGKFHFEVDGVNVTGAINLNSTGNWNTYTTITSPVVSLTAGVKKLRIVFDAPNSKGESFGKFNYIDIKTSDTPAPLPWPITWAVGAIAPTPKFESYGFTYNNLIYSFGGWKDSSFNSTTEMDVYNPATDKWAVIGNMLAPETHAGFALDQVNGIAYFVAGHRGAYPSTPTNEFWKYTIATNTWDRLPDLPAIGGAGLAVIIDGKLHYMGGNLPDRHTNDPRHWVIDLANMSDGWKQLSDMPFAHDHMSRCIVNGQLYVMGGEIGHDILHDQQTTLVRYNSADDTWTTLADMPVARSHAEGSIFEWNGQIVLAGGQTSPQTPLDRVDSYDPITNKWTLLGYLPGPRQGTIVQKVGNQIILTLGGIQTNQPQKTTWIGTIPS